MWRAFTRWAEVWLESFGARALLSSLILLSVLPAHLSDPLRLTFFVAFSVEVGLRGAVLTRKLRAGRITASSGESLALALDVVATASLWPWAHEVLDHDALRLLRVFRMALLVVYWRDYLREFLVLAFRQERLQQLGLVGVFAALLVGMGAASIRAFGIQGLDADEDGTPDERDDYALRRVLWWCFRQVQDPGNLVEVPGSGAVAALSVVLTTGGLLLMALLIGQGANLVGELVAAARKRPLSIFGHTVILNASNDSAGVVSEVVALLGKQLRQPKLVVCSDSPTRPEFLDNARMRRIRWVPGRGTDEETLSRAAIANARRVAILTSNPGTTGDAAAVTSAFTVKQWAPQAAVAVEINEEATMTLLRSRRLDKVVAIRAQRLAALVHAKVIELPGAEWLFDELLSSSGMEIYSAVAGEGAIARLAPVLTVDASFAAVAARAHAEFGCSLLGVLRGGPSSDEVRVELAPTGERLGEIRGLVGVAEHFEVLRRALEDLAANTPAPARFSARISPPARLASPIRRVTIVGVSDQLSHLLVHLLEQNAQLHTLNVVAPSPTAIEEELSRLLPRLRRRQQWKVEPTELSVRVSRPGKPRAEVRLTVADRLDHETVLWPAALQSDRLVLLPSPGLPSERDAATVLAIHHLQALAGALPESHRPLYVSADLADPDKLALLRQSGQESPLRVSLLCTERIREHMLAQCFFVRYLPEIYNAVLSPGVLRDCAVPEELALAPYSELLAQFTGKMGVVPLTVAQAKGGSAQTPQVGRRPSQGRTRRDKDQPMNTERVWIVGSAVER
jgi:voltage-gated potassium channel Kch